MSTEYDQGKIYKVCDASQTLTYYGSTIQTLNARMRGHITDYFQYKENKRTDYLTIFKIFDEFGCGNCKIELVEEFPCNSRSELEKREGHWIRHNACVNKYVAGRTHKEYYEDNTEAILTTVKAYRNANKESIALKKKQYNLANKDTIAQKRSEQTICDVCGGRYSHGGRLRHSRRKKTPKCIEYCTSRARMWIRNS